MQFPEFMQAFPALDVPFPEDMVRSAAVRSDAGLVVFFTFLKDMEVPPHAHKAQWGTVIEGELVLTVGGLAKTYKPGESYSIPSGVEHGAKVTAGTKVIDVFEEADRYSLRG